MINSICELESQIKVSKPMLISTVFGHRGTMPATIDALVHFAIIPKDALWGVTHWAPVSTSWPQPSAWAPT